MIEVLLVENMRKSDAYTIENVTSARELMLRAGTAVEKSVEWKAPVAIVCGSGNNGGDGFVLAGLLKDKDIDCTVFLLDSRFSPDGRYFYDIAVEKGVKSIILTEETIDFSDYSMIVDCIFGTGFHGEAEGLAKAVIEKINSSGAYVVSVDINSGLSGDSGMGQTAVCSDLTVSIGSFKPGHFLGRAKDCIKEKINCDIGISPIGKPFMLLQKNDIREVLAERKNLSNKSTFGYTAIIAGSEKYSGAAKLANISSAALRAGTGVVKLAVPGCIAQGVMPYILESTLFPLSHSVGELLFEPDETDRLLSGICAAAFGMGMGGSEEIRRALEYILKTKEIILVIDADGLNALAKTDSEILKNTRCKVVLTPHVKEFSRLTGRTVDDILSHPVAYAQEFARENRCIVLLKGPSTVVTDGEEVYITDRGCPGMATAGSGDVLSGIITALCGFNKDKLLLATAAGAYINGFAGELAQAESGSISMIASDTVSKIKDAVIEILKD